MPIRSRSQCGSKSEPHLPSFGFQDDVAEASPIFFLLSDSLDDREGEVIVDGEENRGCEMRK